MPPKITRVRWSAQNVPWGISFNEKNGTFSGAPEDVGEYTVPVTVETNYGKDTKDVKIIVTPPVYSVYAIGAKASVWSGNSDPDEDGFYGLTMPKAYELIPNYEGFGARTSEGQFYACGVYLTESRTTHTSVEQTKVSANTPTNVSRMEGGADFERLIFTEGTTSYTKPSNPNIYQHLSFLYRIIVPVEALSSVDLRYGSGILKNSSGTKAIGLNSNTLGSLGKRGGLIFSCEPYNKNGDAYRYLSNYGTTINTYTVRVKENGSCTTSIINSDLGYRAIKFLDAKFDCLSDTYYLDNNPDNFTHGIIKDAWAVKTSVYVQTTGNQLYEYNNGTNDWDLLGIFDIKKVEVPNVNMAFLLTNNGELYHKGNAVSGVTEAHDSFTHIFTSLNFADFTFGGNTLTVLKE